MEEVKSVSPGSDPHEQFTCAVIFGVILCIALELLTHAAPGALQRCALL